MSGCGGNIVAGCCPGPQGPPGPTGPTGPGGGGTAGVGVSMGGNTAGAPSLVSSGTLVLAGGNNITLSQNGQSITFSAGQSTQTQPAGSIAGIGISSATQAGSALGATLSTNRLALAVPQWMPGGGGVDVSMGGNTAGVAGFVSTGTLVLAGGNNVTLSQNGNSITISANTAAAANLSVSAGSTTGAFGGLTFANGSNVSFGLNNGTITANVLAQSVQSQASGIIAGVGTTFNGANISGSMTLNTAGLNLSLSSPVETGIGLSAAGSSQAAGTVVLSNANGVSFGMVGSTVTASVAAGGGGGIDVTLGGNTSGALALVSTGTLFLAGGNNITLSQNGNSVTFSGANAGGAQTGISGLGVSNTTYTSGTLTLQNANGISFGSSGANGISASANFGVVGLQASNTTLTSGTVTLQNANGITFGSSGAGGISASYNSTQFAGTGTTFNGANISGSMTLNSAGLNLSLSGGAGGGGGFSGGVSTGGNTAGNTGTYSGQVVFAGGNNITLSVSSGAAGAQTITISGANAGGAQTGISSVIVSNTTYTSGAISFSNANGISFGSSAGQAITASYTQSGQAFSASGGSSTFSTLVFTNSGGVTFTNTAGSLGAIVATTQALFFLGNTTGQSSSSSIADQTISHSFGGAISGGMSGGSILISAPATSSISGTGLVSVVVNASTISIGAAIPQLSFFQPLGPMQNTTVTQNGLGSVQVYPAIAPFPFTASRADIMISASAAALALSTQPQT